MNTAPPNLAAALNDVITTDTILKRTRRPADFAAENSAMLELASHLSASPADILQKLAEIALPLCNAGSAGVSILEEESDVFRWYAAAGFYAEHRWETLPRNFCPCGTVVDSCAFQLMSSPEKYFKYLADIKPSVAEVLLIPFSVDEKIVGTVWIVTHDTDHHFDGEDIRIVTSLAAFAAAGYKVQTIQKKLEFAIRHRDEFLAVLGHELRNTLSPLMIARSLLCISQLDTVTQQPAVDVLGRQLAYMQRLVDDLLDVSRIAEGKISLAKIAVDVCALVNEAVESAASLATQAQLQLHVTVMSEPVFINADPVRIVQILTNLLNNAIKFTPAGGEITLQVIVDINQVRICVRDTGIGLAPENLNAVFSMFTQIDNPPTNGRGGLGIGLSLAKTFTDLHEGTIRVHSPGLNQGCEFIVSLPTIAAPKQLQSKPQQARSADASVLRILIAEDHSDGAESLCILLRMLGHEVRIAHDGLDTIRQAAVWYPHVVLLDLNLPRIDGYGVIEHLRLNPFTKHCVVLALTGYNTDIDRARTKEHGFDVHLAKPIDVDALRELLNAVVIYDGEERRRVEKPFIGAERRRVYSADAS